MVVDIQNEFDKLGIDYIRNEKISNHTTLKIGGPAKYFVYVKNYKNLFDVINIAKRTKTNLYVIGCGSNLLVSDKGYNGIIIKLDGEFTKIHLKKNILTCGAGVKINNLIKFCLNNSLSGLEELIGIPGTVGGALVMNAGTKKFSISKNLLGVQVLDKNKEKIFLKNIEKKKLFFGYRNSNLKDYLITSASFKMKICKKKDLYNKIKKTLSEKKQKQPINSFSAGCIFKNPDNMNLSAGMLIEKCGLKGFRIGDVVVSQKHANYLVNLGNATAKDFIKLMRYIVRKVEKKFGIILEPEVRLLNLKL